MTPTPDPTPARPWPAAWVNARAALQAQWAGLATRERSALTAAATVIGLALLWWVAIAPAWRTLQEVPARIDRQGLQLQTLQQLAAETAELRTLAPVSSAQAGAALDSASARYGARISLQRLGDQATVSVRELTGDELRDWLAEVRSTARARTTEAQLSRSGQGYTGTLVLSLGSRP